MPVIVDPVEHAKRENRLKKNEKLVKKTNEEFLEGKILWHDAINEFSDLPKDEFEKEKTGDKAPEADRFGLGNIEPTGADRVDEESERYFAEFRESMKRDRGSIPSTYNAVKRGLVSEVKNQKQCGSCVAFSNMALIETCFRKETGIFSDFSEQHLVDCGYGQNGAKGCDGAWTHAYVKWAEDGKDLLAEATYPYMNTEPALTCPANLDAYKRGAKVTRALYTYGGDEELLKEVVAMKGAAVTSVSAYGPMQEYSGGIFSGCTSKETDHAVTVVGYGTDRDSGKDYWLIKNSWGKDWGEEGYIRLERGVGMCGIGSTIVIIECEAVSGPTSATLTTETPCDDKFSNCAEVAQTSCWKPSITEGCPKSCGLCKGQTPVSSNTCYDEYGNCAELAKTDCWSSTGSSCKKSCGLCEGMTPAASNTCYNKYTNCGALCSDSELANMDCKKACGKC